MSPRERDLADCRRFLDFQADPDFREMMYAQVDKASDDDLYVQAAAAREFLASLGAELEAYRRAKSAAKQG